MTLIPLMRLIAVGLFILFWADPSWAAYQVPVSTCDQMQTGTGSAGTGFTVTLPSDPNLSHHICSIEVTMFAATTLLAGATPNLLTSTNLNSYAISFSASALGIGQVEQRMYSPGFPYKAAAPNVATTITVPAVTGVIWRVTVWYFLGP